MAQPKHDFRYIQQHYIDPYVELYLLHIIRPFLGFHDKFYSKMNRVLRSKLDRYQTVIPRWFTANFITYARTVLIIPTLTLLSLEYVWWVSFMVMFVDFGDFLDGVVARFWMDVKKGEEKKKDGDDSSTTPPNGKLIPSLKTKTRDQAYGGFVDAVCDKAFVVPCWIFLLSTIRTHSSGGMSWVRQVQHVTLWCLILAETSSGCVRFRAYFESYGVKAPAVKGLDFSTSAVKADGIGKAKQTLEMVGTSLFVLPSLFRYLGLILLMAAVPLAYESVRRKIKRRVIYVDGTEAGSEKLDPDTLKFWMQARMMGSELVVGVVEEEKGKIAMLLPFVDRVIVGAPLAKMGVEFVKGHGVDYVIIRDEKSGVVSPEVRKAKKCLVLDLDEGVAHLVTK